MHQAVEKLGTDDDGAAIVRILLNHGADVTIKTDKGKTAYDLALASRHWSPGDKMLKMLDPANAGHAKNNP